jgi:hypothetical protein
MLFGVYSPLLAGTGLGMSPPSAPDVKLISTTNISVFHLGHAAMNAGLPVGPDAQPMRLCHLYNYVQKAVQNTATCLLTIIGISGPLISGTNSAAEGCLTSIQVMYHKIIPVPVVDNAHFCPIYPPHAAPVDQTVSNSSLLSSRGFY